MNGTTLEHSNGNNDGKNDLKMEKPTPLNENGHALPRLCILLLMIHIYSTMPSYCIPFHIIIYPLLPYLLLEKEK
jgi:hypothetical protein